MGIGATQHSVSESYDRIKRAQSNLHVAAERAIARIDAGAVEFNYLLNDLVPQIKNLLEQIPDAGLFPAAWITKIADYAATQTLTVSSDYLADYQSVRAAAIDALAAVVAELPTVNGKNNFDSIDSSGNRIFDTAGDLSALRAALLTLRDSAE